VSFQKKQLLLNQKVGGLKEEKENWAYFLRTIAPSMLLGAML
jgi:hypothetical protein